MDERLLFIRLMKERGLPAPTPRLLRIQPPLDNSGETDCWTHAAAYARETGAVYVEGICYLPPKEDGRPRVAAHAWCVEDSPFGARVVEFTPGYEQAFGYLGLPLDLDSTAGRRAEVDGRRYSIIELDFAIKERGGTPS